MKVILTAHGGSSNHGCEAIVRSTIGILNGQKEFLLFSADKISDQLFNIDDICSIGECRNSVKRYSVHHILLSLGSKLMKYDNAYLRNIFKELIESINPGDIVLSIGGDNYCYGVPIAMMFINNIAIQKQAKTVLWGCSVNPEALRSHRVVNDLNRYSLITARESITYDALVAAGIKKNTVLFPDPAFTLKMIEKDLQPRFVKGNTVGVNVSPLVLGYGKDKDLVMRNYSFLIQHLLKTTDMQVALIPHVVQAKNNDLEPLTVLYKEFQDTGRIVLIDNRNCMELKGYISRCRMFIGARTHATIAAYSTNVPTLVLGYSVKAKGIAKDIFGTFDNYVLPVQSLQKEDDLTKAFKWLCNHEENIRAHLQSFMPSYIKRAWEAGSEINKLIGGFNV